RDSLHQSAADEDGRGSETSLRLLPWRLASDGISSRHRGIPEFPISNSMTDHQRYSSPLAQRYASREMLELWSAETRHGLWRRLWLVLAEAERELGVEIPAEAIAQMRDQLDNIDFKGVAVYEKRYRHDVMAHVHAFGDVAPAAK